MLLKIVSIVLGVLVVITRGWGTLFPESARTLMRGMLARKRLMLVLALVAALAGALIAGAARVYLADVAVNWQAIVLLVLGIFVALVGLVFLAAPAVPTRIAGKFLTVSATTFRLACLVGVAFGAVMLYAGITMPRVAG